MSKRCTKCKKIVATLGGYCPACGSPLKPVVKKCSYCQASVNPGQDFCVWCGEKLK